MTDTAEMREAELLPCPFCGTPSPIILNVAGSYRIMCTGAGCSGTQITRSDDRNAGVDLEAAVEAKFNATSEKVGLATRYARVLPAREADDGK